MRRCGASAVLLAGVAPLGWGGGGCAAVEGWWCRMGMMGGEEVCLCV